MALTKELQKKVSGPIRVSATGPDGAGKDTAWRYAKSQLPEDLLILKIGKPTSYFVGGVETFVQSAQSRQLDLFHEWADARRSKVLTSLANTLYVVFQWRFQEPSWTQKLAPDMVFSLRDGYVDPSAYARYYTPTTLGKLSVPDRIKALRAIHGSPYRDHTVFLDISPEVAVRRIQMRIEAESAMPVDGKPVRPKWQHQHENVKDLTFIRGEYREVLGHLNHWCGTRVTEVAVDGKPKEQVGRELARSIMTNFS